MNDEILVTMPLQLSSSMLRAVRSDPLTSIEDKDEMNTRIGWLLCAWDVLVEHRQASITPSPL
jgi:hypothetical protein